jgi:O-antigen ligase
MLLLEMQTRSSFYKILTLLLCSSACFPLFCLIVKGWVSGVLFFATLIAVILLILPFFKSLPEGMVIKSNLFCRDRLGLFIILFIIAFTLPFFSVALGQFLQGSWNIARFDAPSRYLFAITIFLVIVRYKTVVHLVLDYTIPASTIFTLALIQFVPTTFWSTYPGRLSNHFIDPLIFGQVTLALGMMSFLMIRLNRDRSLWIVLLQLIGGVAGIYLSLRSGSRTGWLAIPLVVFLWALYSIPLARWKTSLLAIVFTVLTILVIYFGSNTMKVRFNDFYTELTNYRWSEMNADTNVGVRISWIRIGWHFFSMRPLSGWGDETLVNNINDPTIAVYASQESRDGVLIAGFHNDFVSNTVRYGVGGLVATIAIFFIPFLFFTYYIGNKQVKSYAIVGMGYVLIQSVSSLSYHVLDFKFMASFYAMMICLLIGIMVNKLKS